MTSRRHRADPWRRRRASRRCIESVLAAPQADAVRTRRRQRCLGRRRTRRAGCATSRAERRITLLDAPERQGLAAALNRGDGAASRSGSRCRRPAERRREVAGDWLDRLARPRAAPSDIGTVVPFASVRRGRRLSAHRTAPTRFRAGQSAASLDQLFHRANAGVAVERAAVLRAVHLLSARVPECGRSIQRTGGRETQGVARRILACAPAGAGFRHLLAADVYVWYQGDA